MVGTSQDNQTKVFLVGKCQDETGVSRYDI